MIIIIYAIHIKNIEIRNYCKTMCCQPYKSSKKVDFAWDICWFPQFAKPIPESASQPDLHLLFMPIRFRKVSETLGRNWGKWRWYGAGALSIAPPHMNTEPKPYLTNLSLARNGSTKFQRPHIEQPCKKHSRQISSPRSIWNKIKIVQHLFELVFQPCIRVTNRKIQH